MYERNLKSPFGHGNIPSIRIRWRFRCTIVFMTLPFRLRTANRHRAITRDTKPTVSTSVARKLINVFFLLLFSRSLKKYVWRTSKTKQKFKKKTADDQTVHRYSLWLFSQPGPVQETGAVSDKQKLIVQYQLGIFTIDKGIHPTPVSCYSITTQGAKNISLSHKTSRPHLQHRFHLWRKKL